METLLLILFLGTTGGVYISNSSQASRAEVSTSSALRDASRPIVGGPVMYVMMMMFT
jgi:hypothetical protein